MNKIDAVFLDLDGTLLNSKKVVSQKNKQVLMHCMNSGIDVYIVSGDPYFMWIKLRIRLIKDVVELHLMGQCIK